MVKFRKGNESSDIAKLEDVSEVDSTRKPSWVNLTQLENSDSILDKLAFQPALRFHGLTGGFWGQNVATSVANDSPPPSYRVSISGTSTKFNEPCSTCDPSSMTGAANVSAVSPLTLRRKNTLAVVLIAVALLATIAAITGIVLHFMQPKEMLRANVYFTIANRNFTDEMNNRSSSDFEDIAKPLCSEMDQYFLTSELAEYYLQCKIVTLRQNDTKPGVAVHVSLDFDENKVTNDGERIRNIILKKSGKLVSNDTLFLVIKTFLVYLKSLRVELEVQPKPDEIPYRPRIPWREDVDFIARKSEIELDTSEAGFTNSAINQIFTTAFVDAPVHKSVLANVNTRLGSVLYPSMYIASAHKDRTVEIVLETALPVQNVLVTAHPVLHPTTISTYVGKQSLNIIPSRASIFQADIRKLDGFEKDSNPLLNKHSSDHKIQTKHRSFQRDDMVITTDVNDDKSNPDAFISEINAKEFEIKKNVKVQKKKLRRLDLKINETIKNQRKTENRENSNQRPLVSANKPNVIQINDANPEKVLTIFTDVFVILGTDAQTDQPIFEDTETAILESTVSEIYPTETHFRFESDFTHHPVEERVIDMPQPSFINIADNLLNDRQMSSISATTSSSRLMESKLILPAEIRPPKLLVKPIQSIILTKQIADPGTLLLKEPKIIVIQTNRKLLQNNGKFLTHESQIKTNQNPILIKHNKSNAMVHQRKPEIIPNEITETPELLEMQEISFPRVATNQTLDIQWINIFHVQSAIAASKTKKNLRKEAVTTREVVLEEKPKDITFDEAIPSNGVRDGDLIDLVPHTDEFAQADLDFPISKPQQVTDISETDNKTNKNQMRVPLFDRNDQRTGKQNILISQQENYLQPEQSSWIHDTFTFKSPDGKNNFIHVITRPISNLTESYYEMNPIPNERHIKQPSHLSKSMVTTWSVPFSPTNNILDINSKSNTNYLPSQDAKHIGNTHAVKLPAHNRARNTLRKAPKRNITSVRRVTNTLREEFAFPKQRHANGDTQTDSESSILHPRHVSKDNSLHQDTTHSPYRVNANSGKLNEDFHFDLQRTYPTIEENNIMLPRKSLPLNTDKQKHVHVPSHYFHNRKRQSMIENIASASGNAVDKWDNGNQGLSANAQPVHSDGVSRQSEQSIPLKTRFSKDSRTEQVTSFQTKSENGLSLNGNAGYSGNKRYIQSNYISQVDSVLGGLSNITMLPNKITLRKHARLAFPNTHKNSHQFQVRNHIQSSDPIKRLQHLQKFPLDVNHQDVFAFSDRSLKHRNYWQRRNTIHNTYLVQEINNLQTPINRQRRVNDLFSNQQIGKIPNKLHLRYYPKHTTYQNSYNAQPSFNGIYPTDKASVTNGYIYKPPSRQHLRKLKMVHKHKRQNQMSLLDRQFYLYRIKRINPTWVWTRRKHVAKYIPSSLITKNIGEMNTYPLYEGYWKSWPDNFPEYNKWCLPGYPNFSDIVEMKTVLQQLVDSLFEMTNKINKMQHAIDYINNTFHERNESLKSVADTIAAMTGSLNNFNANLNDINATLKSFKFFMKDLNNSMFNINDVIKYLDDSIVNLDKTVAHLDDSVQDLNGTLLVIRIRSEDIDTSLKMINRTVIDVRDTTESTNITLDSMNKTLLKLDDIIFSLGKKIDETLSGLDGINISLKNINESIYNSYARLSKLGHKIVLMNKTIENINVTMTRLNDSFERIEKVLHQMNESFEFLPGTMLEELLNLRVLNGILGNVSYNVELIDTNKDTTNKSLSEALDWLNVMMDIVNSLNVTVEKQNETLIIGLEDKHLLNTLNSLLSMNKSLSNTSNDVDDVNDKLSYMEHKMGVLEESLKRIEDSLANMNVTLTFLNKLLNKVKTTLKEIKEPLNSINGTLQRLVKTSDDIRVSLDNVKQTTDSANKSSQAISGFISRAGDSAKQLNKTISNIVLNTDGLFDNVVIFTDEVHNLTGSLKELNKKVFDDEESLKMIKAEYSILNNSMNIVNEKLTVLTNSFTMMNDELNKTAVAINASEANSLDIGQTNGEVNHKLQGILATLNDINSSLAELNLNFINISSAFPRIDMKISDVISTTNELIELTEVLSNENMNSEEIGQNVSAAASFLADNVSSLQNMMENLRNTIADLNLSKLNATNKLRQLSNHLKVAEARQEANSRKVELLNPSFRELKHTYNLLTNKSVIVLKHANKKVKILNGLDQRLRVFKDIMRNYPNLRVDLDVESNNLSNILSALLQSNILFNDSFLALKSHNNLVWYDNGSPKVKNLTLAQVEENIRSLNSTLNNHSHVIKDYLLINGTADGFSNILSAKLNALNKTIKTLDSMESKFSRIDSSLLPLIKSYDDQIKKIDNLTEYLMNVLDDLDRIERDYKSVSDSTNNTHIVLRQKLLQSLDTLISQKQKAKNDRELLLKATKNYNEMLKDLENTRFGIDETSRLKINDVLGKLSETLVLIDNLTEAWNTIGNATSSTSQFLEETDSQIKQIERDVQTTIRKHKYTELYGQKIRNELDAFPFTVNDTMGMIHQRKKTVSQLENFCEKLNANAEHFGTLNFTFKEELHFLNDSTVVLDHLHGHLKDAANIFKELSREYETFDTENASLSEVKFQYEKHLSSLASLKDEMHKSQNKMLLMDSDLKNVKANLDKTSTHLNLYNLTESYLNKTGEMLIEVTFKTQNLEEKLNNSLNKFKDVSSYFETIENNYSNVSSSDSKAPATYIRDLIQEKQRKLNLTKSSLMNISWVHSNSSLDFRGLNDSFWKTVSTRNDVFEQMLATNESLNNIQENLSWLQGELNNIDIGLLHINKSLHGMDDVLHTRNQELFIKRQKQLYVSEKLPDIIDRYHQVNQSLADAERKRNQLLQLVSDLRAQKTGVNKQQDEFRYVNISLKETEEHLRDTERFTKGLLSTLAILNDAYLLINKSVVSKNAPEIFNNMPLEHIKYVFEDALNTLDNISSNLNTVMVYAESHESQLMSEGSTLTNLTLLINKFKEIHGKLANHIKNSTNIGKESVSIDENIDILRKNIDYSLFYLSTLEERYGNLNSSILKGILNIPRNLSSSLVEQFAKLTEAQNNSISFLPVMEEEIKDIQDKLGENVSTPDALKTVIDMLYPKQNDLDKIIAGIISDHAYLQNQVSSLQTNTSHLSIGLHSAEEKLKIQEKQKYVKEILPDMQLHHAYLEDRITNTSNSLQSVEELLNFIKLLHNSTKAMIEDHPKLNISIEDSFKKIERTRGILENNTDWLTGIGIENQDLKANLTESYYLENINNFDIDDLKSTLNVLNNTLLRRAKNLDHIDDNEQNAFQSLKSIESYYDAVDSGRDVINSVSTVSDSVINKWLNYDELLMNINDTMVVIEENILNMTDNIMNMNMSFKHIEDTNLQKKLQFMENQLRILQNKFDLLHNTLKKLDENNTNTAHDVNDLVKLRSLPVASLEKLYQDKNQMEYLSSKIDNSTSQGKHLLNQTYSLVNNLLSDLDILRNISDDLKRDFNKQEKIEYLENVLPSLERKHEEIENTVLESNTTINTLLEYLSNASKLLQTLSERLNNTVNVNISLSKIKNEYDRIETELSLLIKDLETESHNLDTFNISKLRNNSSLTDGNLSISTLKQFISDLEKTLNDTWLSVNTTLITSNTISNKLGNSNADVLELIDDLDRLLALENEISSTETDLSRLVHNLTATNNKVGILTNHLKYLNDSLNDVLLNINGINNSELTERVKHFQSTLNENILKVAQLENYLKDENANFENASNTLDELKILFDSVAQSQAGLDFKLDEGSKLQKLLRAERLKLSDRLTNETGEIPDIFLDIETLKTNLEKIRKDVEQEQIKIFIGHNFPDMLQHFRFLNTTILNQTDMLNKVQNSVYELRNKTISINDTMSLYPSLNISLDIIWNKSSEMIKNIKQMHGKLENVTHIFDNFGLELINDSNINATVEGIKARFSKKMDILMTLSENVNNFTQPLEKINQETEFYNDKLSENNKTLTLYNAMLNQLESLSSFYDDINTVSYGISNRHINTTDFISLLNKDIQDVNHRFSHVSDEILDQTKENIRINMSAEDAYLKYLNVLHNDTYEEFLNQKNVLLDNIALLNTTVDSFDNLHEQLQRISKATVSLLKYGQHISGNFTSMNQTLDDQARRLSELNDKISTLKEMYTEKEKTDFINSNLPLLTKFIEDVRDNLNDSNASLAAGYDSLKQTTDLLRNMTELLLNQSLINISTEMLRSQMKTFQQMLDTSKNGLTNATLRFNNLNMSSFDPNTFLTLPIETLRTEYTMLNKSLDDIIDSVSYINKSVIETKAETKSSEQFINNTFNKIVKYLQLEEDSSLISEVVSKTSEGVKDVMDMFDDVENMLKNQIAELNGILLHSNDRSNATKNSIKFLLSDVNAMSARLSKIKGNFTKSITDENNENIDSIKAVTVLLAKMISTFEDLENNTKLVGNMLKDISEKNENIVEGTKSYQNDILNIQKHLHENDQKLLNLKELLRKESKDSFIEMTYPKIFERYNRLNITFTDVFKNLSANNESLHDVLKHVKNINNKTDRISHISNLTAPQTDQIEVIKDNLKNMFLNLSTAAQTYASFNISVLNDKRLIVNDSILIAQIENVYSEYNKSFAELESVVEFVLLRNDEIESTINDLDLQISQIDNMLRLTSSLETELISLGQEAKYVQRNKTKLSGQVEKADTKLKRNEHLLAQLRKSYEDFIDNTSAEDKMIQNTRSKIDNLKNLLKKATREYEMIENHFLDSNVTFYQKINSSKTLQTVLDAVNRELPIVDLKLRELSDKLKHAWKEIPTLDTELMSVDKKIKDLEWMLSNQQNKSNILQQIKPLTQQIILSTAEAFRQTSDSIQKLTDNGNKTQDAIEDLKERLNRMLSINIPLNHLETNISSIKKEIVSIRNNYDELRNSFHNVNNEIQAYKFLNKSLTAEDVELKYNEFNKSLHEISEKLHKLTAKAEGLQPVYFAINHEINQVNKSLDEYTIEESEIATLGGNLHSVDESLKRSIGDMDKVQAYVKHVTESFDSLKEQYSDVIHTVADNVSEVELILKEAHQFLTNGSKGLENLSAQLTDAKSMLKSGYDILHGDINTYSKLNKSVDYVFQLNKEIREHLHFVQNKNLLLYNQTVNLNGSLKDIPYVLDILRMALNREQKTKYINETFPEYETKFAHMNVSLGGSYNDLMDTKELLRSLLYKYYIAESKIMNIPSVNISTTVYMKEIAEFQKTLDDLFEALKVASNNLALLDAKDINGQNIIENDTVSLYILTENYNRSNHILNETNESLEWIERENKNLTSNITESLRDIVQIIDVLKRFDSISSDFRLVSEEMPAAQKNISDVNEDLKIIKGQIENLNSTLLALETNSSKFEYNSSSERRMLQKVNNEFKIIELMFHDASLLLSNLEKVQTDINGTLFDIFDNPKLLNHTLTEVEIKTDALKEELYKFKVALTKIKEKMPKVDMNVSNTGIALADMESVLKRQQSKAYFVEDAKPALQDRMDNTTTAFQRTNLSLEIMRQQIESLQNYVDSVKARLDAFPTVNISLSDIDTNITEMENRIIIMQDYYNNVQEVIAQLHGNIDTFDIFNVTLTPDNVKDRYAMFNHTLDDVNSVLGKIGREFNAFGSQFTNINKTLGNIDDAISRFEEKTTKIKVLEKDINSFGSTLNETTKAIEEMISAAHQLNDSYFTLKINYSDVINRTEERNADIEQKINDIDKYLKDAKSIIDNVAQFYRASQSNISMINQSLFKDIYTYEDLNATLADVKYAYSIIRSQLKGMAQIIDDKSNETTHFNSTLAGVSYVLEDLKQILDTEQKDLEKVQFINSHIDDLKNHFTALQSPAHTSRGSVAKQSEKIDHLQQLVQKTENRLNRFRTLNITTDPEKKKTEELKNVMAELKRNLTATDQTIDKVRGLMASLQDRNASIEEIRAKFESVNATINALNSALEDIQSKLETAKNETMATNEAVLNFQSAMNTLKTLQNGLTKIKNQMALLDTRNSQTLNDLGETGTILEKLDKMFKAMDLMQVILNDSDYKAFKSNADSVLTEFNKSYTKLENESSDILTRLNNAKQSLDELMNSIKATLTRDSVETAIEDLQKQFQRTTKLIDELHAPTTNTNQKANTLLSGVKSFNTKTVEMKDLLTKETEKYRFVEGKLPLLQLEHNVINQSLMEVRPSIEIVRSKLTHMKEVMAKIKEKIKLFGVEDSDGKIQEWDKQINKTELILKEMDRKYHNSMGIIDRLKGELWKDIKEMFTKEDTLPAVKSKFDKFNKTLTEIDVVLEDIILTIGDLDILANTMGQDLMDRNMILTTTPPTTTPSGAPDWLNFSSSGGSVIGRDSATLECRVDDLTMWQMMKIEKVTEDGNKVVLAAWKLGVRAQKTVRDRRITVRKNEDGVSGSLIVTINKLSCEDEATYLCTINTYHMWPLRTSLAVSRLPEDSLTSNFPTEVFEDKTATFACTGYPGYPDGEITWRIRHENETDFHDFDFYSQISNVSNENCRVKEINSVPFQFDMSWNNTFVRCYIANTDYYAQGQIRLLPFDICNNVRYLGTISHPYTPHKFIVCGKELNIMQCPGNTCYDDNEHNCVQCKADHQKGDPCLGQPLYSYVAHETDCTKYYICMGPTKSTKKCTRGYFSPRVPGYCVLAYSVSECARKEKQR